MFKSITMYQIVCDRCGKVFEGTETCSDIFEKPFIEDLGGCSDWEEINGKHYCDACYDVEIIDGMYNVEPKK